MIQSAELELVRCYRGIGVKFNWSKPDFSMRYTQSPESSEFDGLFFLELRSWGGPPSPNLVALPTLGLVWFLKFVGWLDSKCYRYIFSILLEACSTCVGHGRETTRSRRSTLKSCRCQSWLTSWEYPKRDKWTPSTVTSRPRLINVVLLGHK